MNILLALLISTLAGLSTVLGSLVIFIRVKESSVNKFITFSLSFSLAIMIGISITDLIPESFYTLVFKYGLDKSLLTLLFTLLSGVGIVNILNRLEDKNKNNLYRLGIINMIALMIHNFPEGIATFLSSMNDINLGIKLSIAIMLHNIPEGIAIAVPIYYGTKSKSTAIKNTFISGLSEPLGAVLAYIVLGSFVTKEIISIVLLFVAGIMIALSINKLLPTALEYKCNKYISLGIVIGVLFLIVSLLVN